MEDVNVSDQDLQRYGQQLERLLAFNEQQFGTGTGESGKQLSERDLARHGETEVPKTNPENETRSDMQRRDPRDVAQRNSKKETWGDLERQAPRHAPEKHTENGALRDMVSHEASFEAIEACAQETSTEPVDTTDPMTQIHRRQLLAICGLLGGSTITDTALQIGVNRRTIHRWMHDPKFQAAYRHCEAELRMAAQAQVAGLTDKAIRCLSESLDRGNARVGLELLKLLRVFSTRNTPDRIAQAEARSAATLLDVEEES